MCIYRFCILEKNNCSIILQYPSHLEIPKIPEKSNEVTASFIQDTAFPHFISSENVSGFPMKSRSGQSGSQLTKDIITPSSMLATSTSIKDGRFRSLDPVKEKSGMKFVIHLLSD